MYEIVISGARDSLNARVVAGLEALGPKIGSSTAASRFNLSVAQKAKGLKPNGDALFARTVDEIKNAYQTNDMGPVVPILVEYRRIAGTKAAAQERIDWTAPPNATEPVRVRMLKVAGNNSDWTTSGLTVAANDLVVGFANGKVDDGSFGGNWVEADNRGSGGLEVRAGGNVSAAGKSWALIKATGEIKLRVRDTSWNDNKGAFDVVIVVVPGGSLRAADCQKQDTNGNFGSCTVP